MTPPIFTDSANPLLHSFNIRAPPSDGERRAFTTSVTGQGDFALWPESGGHRWVRLAPTLFAKP